MSLFQQIPVVSHIKTELAFIIIIVLETMYSPKPNRVYGSSKVIIDLLKKETDSLHTFWLRIDAFVYYMLEFGPRHKSQISCPWATNSLQRHFLWPIQYLLKIAHNGLSTS